MEHKQEKILIVDDEFANINILVEILKSDYRIAVAKNGKEALKLAISNHPPDLVLLDIMMPEIDGYEVCERLKSSAGTSDIPVIFITARGLEEDETRGFEAGAVDYITKPVKPGIVRSRVKTHLDLKRAKTQLENQNIVLEEKVRERTEELRDSRLELVHRLVFAAEYKDPDTGSHIKRISHYSELLALRRGLAGLDCETILLASPMHDIGKIGVPDSILMKPGRLDPEEWKIMKTHSEIGARILSSSRSPFIEAGRSIAISHHERWDGSGYPHGLKGETIPIIGRITALADVFDALTTSRPYKDAWPVEMAVAEIEMGRGSHFDPEIVDLFMEILPDIVEIKDQFPEKET